MKKRQTGHSAHNCGFMHYSETAQSSRLEKNTDNMKYLVVTQELYLTLKSEKNVF